METVRTLQEVQDAHARQLTQLKVCFLLVLWHCHETALEAAYL